MYRKLHLTELLVATAILGVAAAETAAQTTQAQVLTTSATVLSACYVPATGTVYLVGEAGIPGQCANPAHIAFSWNAEGVQGPQGSTGLIGPQGEPGVAGPVGPKGVDGADGTGLVGAQGPAGVQGAPGVAGPIGPQGLVGADGVQGVQGDTGVAGPQGVAGATGPAGVQGVQGDTGATGPQGVAGVSGLEIVSATRLYVFGLNNASLDCPVGKVAIAGGYDLRMPVADPNGARVVTSRRDPLNAQRWLWIIADDWGFAPDFELQVICVSAS